jgi:hypothetical protein
VSVTLVRARSNWSDAQANHYFGFYFNQAYGRRRSLDPDFLMDLTDETTLDEWDDYYAGGSCAAGRMCLTGSGCHTKMAVRDHFNLEWNIRAVSSCDSLVDQDGGLTIREGAVRIKKGDVCLAGLGVPMSDGAVPGQCETQIDWFDPPSGVFVAEFDVIRVAPGKWYQGPDKAQGVDGWVCSGWGTEVLTYSYDRVFTTGRRPDLGPH